MNPVDTFAALVESIRRGSGTGFAIERAEEACALLTAAEISAEIASAKRWCDLMEGRR